VTSTRFPKWTNVIISRLVVIPGCNISDPTAPSSVSNPQSQEEKAVFVLCEWLRECLLLASVVPSFLSFRLRSSAAHAEEEVTSHNKLSPWSETHLSESLMLLVRRSAVGFGGVARWGLRCLCSGDAAGRYRDTVLLPRTDFPMKVNGPNLLEREIEIQQVRVSDLTAYPGPATCC